MKQETLEEAKQNYLNKCVTEVRNTGYCDEDFEQGAKWQQQRSYTEEEMKQFARSYFREIKLERSNTAWDDLADRCFEQFKKK